MPSRRTLLALIAGSLAGAGGALLFLERKINPRTPLAYDWPLAAPASAEPTPACEDHDPTPALTEGPFYTPSTPERSMLREADTVGRALRLEGRVVSRDCRPIAGAVVDVWSCDGQGEYDNAGFRLRGHQFTDGDGRFVFETIKPAPYRQYGVERTAHLHLKLQGRDTALLTTQLFFPGEALNDGDLLYDERLLVDVEASGENLVGRFTFVLAAGVDPSGPGNTSAGRSNT